MKNIKTFEGFLDKFRNKDTSDILPKPVQQEIRGEKIEINDITDIYGETLYDPQTERQLYVNGEGDIELIDPDGNGGDGIVIFQGVMPEPGKTIDLEYNVYDSDDDCEHGVYLDENLSYFEFILDNKVKYVFHLDDAENVTEYYDY